MAARTGDRYLQGLKDDRTVWLGNKQVDVSWLNPSSLDLCAERRAISIGSTATLRIAWLRTR